MLKVNSETCKGIMDFSWSEEQLEFKQRVIDFARRQLNHDISENDRRGEFFRTAWEKCAEFGIQGLAMAEQYGGLNQDILTATLAMEALGYACKDTALLLGLNGQMWTVQLTLQEFGSDAQKQRFLPGFCSGQLIGAQAVTEPEAGSDTGSIRTHAEKWKDGYRLNGSKVMVTLAPVADVAIVLATINPQLGKWGITAFLVEKGTPGFHAGPPRDKMGLRTVPLGDFFFDDCRIPEENRLGPEGAGLSLFNSSLEWERSCMLASFIGVMERQLEECITYARTRKQFGKPIGKFQSVSNRIAEMKVRLETARLLLYKVAWLKKNGKPAALEAAMVKLYLNECFVQSSMDAVRIHGGYGYMSEFDAQRDLRDAIGGTLYGGTSDIQRNIIARLLGV